MALTDLFPPEHKNKVIAVAFTIVGVVFGIIISAPFCVVKQRPEDLGLTNTSSCVGKEALQKYSHGAIARRYIAVARQLSYNAIVRTSLYVYIHLSCCQRLGLDTQHTRRYIYIRTVCV